MSRPLNIHSSKTTTILIHMLVWLLIYALPLIVTSLLLDSYSIEDLPKDAYLNYSLTLLFHQIVFYLNYFVFFKKFLMKRRVVALLAVNIVIAVLFAALLHFFTTFITLGHVPDIEKAAEIRKIMVSTPVRHGFITGISITLLFASLISNTIKSAVTLYAQAHQQKELEKKKAEAELKNLKNKLNPHFLFNALNNIYALTAIDTDKAQAAIDSLSKLLRYVLYENDSELVPLEGEIEFTRCYVDLMSLRLDPARSTINVSIQDCPSGNWTVATLMFMTLIENSFKHGVSSREHSFIDIDIHTEDKENGQKDIVCTVANSLFPKDESDKSGHGIGLDNLRQRLDIHYGQQASYVVTATENQYKSILRIPLRKAI